MPPPRSDLLVQVIGKTPLFKGFSPTQVRQVLGMCEHRVLEPGQTLCAAEASSDELFILVAGELELQNAEGVRLGRVSPVALVQEVQVLTGRPYAANVAVSTASHVFAIPRAQFERVLRRDLDMQIKTYRNLADLLADRAGGQDEAGAEWERENSRLESRMVALERQLKFQTQKCEAALALLAATGDMSRDEVEVHIADRLRDVVPRVLIVDDEPDFRKFVTEVLGAFAVLEAGSGQEALEILQEEQLDLVITDIMMPGMDGHTLLTNLRSRYPGLPVMGVSGFVDEDQVEPPTFDSFIDKPVPAEKLLELVETALSDQV